MVAPKQTRAVPRSHIDVAIIGGGVVGCVAAKRMQERGIAFKVIERQRDFGGVWHTHGNNHSTLQAPKLSHRFRFKYPLAKIGPQEQSTEDNVLERLRNIARDLSNHEHCKTQHIFMSAPELSYRFHTKYPLGKNGPLEQITGNNVLRRLRDMARDLDFYEHTNFCSEVETIRMEDGSYVLSIRDLNTKEERHLVAEHIIVCHGILGRQYSPQERGLTVDKSFKGVFTLGGRMNGTDCAVNNQDINGKKVVVIGGGAFACEAMRSAVWNGASSITLLTREKSKWVIPFSRQFLASAIGMTPILPWAHKMALVKHWLIRCYYRPCHMEHLIPEGGPKDMNYTGQSHDGYFEFSRHGQVKHALGNAKLVSEKGVTTKDGTVYPADMVVFCGGCEYQGSPPFLAELKLGFEDLHSFAFIGNSGRIATASDGLFSYVPAGPNKQVDMFLRAYDLRKQGRLQVLRASLDHTPIPHEDVISKGHRTVWYTWFETFDKDSHLSCLFELRNSAYKKVMSAGLTGNAKLWLAARLWWGELFLWNLLCVLAIMEKFHKWRIH